MPYKPVSDLFVVTFARGTAYDPAQKYIFPLDALFEILQYQKKFHRYVESIQQLYAPEEKFVTNYHSASLGKFVFVHGYYTGGDQLWYSAFLFDWHTQSKTTLFGVPGLKNSEGIWEGNPFVMDLQFPIEKETFDNYDYIADLRAVTAPFDKNDNRSHPRRYCEAFGIPWKADKPVVQMSVAENHTLLREVFDDRIQAGHGYYVIQMHGQWETHAFALQQLRAIAERLDAPAFFLGFQQKGDALWRGMNLFKPERSGLEPCIYQGTVEGNISLTTREVLALVSGAKGVICPDSFLQHAAAAFDIPCVAVCGTHNPERLGDYKTVRRIHHKEQCPLAPCGVASHGFPQGCPSAPFGVCGVVAGVPVDEIFAELEIAIAEASHVS